MHEPLRMRNAPLKPDTLPLGMMLWPPAPGDMDPGCPPDSPEFSIDFSESSIFPYIFVPKGQTKPSLLNCFTADIYIIA